jgi:hypothetical protein
MGFLPNRGRSRPALAWVDDSASKLDDARQRLSQVQDAEAGQ